MLIVDVIREADNEHEIYFLLTSYVEAVRYCDKLTILPDPMRELPFVGMEDVQARIEALRGELGEPSREADRRDRDIVTEAMAIFNVALDRLVSLKERTLRQMPMAA
jgi:hypothetical protein